MGVGILFSRVYGLWAWGVLAGSMAFGGGDSV